MAGLNVLAAAGSQAPLTEFSYIDEGPQASWDAVIAVGVVGVIFLPVAMLIVWLLRRIGWNRSVGFDAVIGALGSLLAFGLVRFVNLAAFQEKTLAQAAAETFRLDDPFSMIVQGTVFGIGWLGAILFGRRLHRRAQPHHPVETFE